MDSFVRFNQVRRMSHELDGFLVRSWDKGTMVGRMRTAQEKTLSDH